MWKICVLIFHDPISAVVCKFGQQTQNKLTKKNNESPEHLLLIHQHGGVNATVTSWNVHADAL